LAMSCYCSPCWVRRQSAHLVSRQSMKSLNERFWTGRPQPLQIVSPSTASGHVLSTHATSASTAVTVTSLNIGSQPHDSKALWMPAFSMNGRAGRRKPSQEHDGNGGRVTGCTAYGRSALFGKSVVVHGDWFP
jgi:hypothetical protein